MECDVNNCVCLELAGRARDEGALARRVESGDARQHILAMGAETSVPLFRLPPKLAAQAASYGGCRPATPALSPLPLPFPAPAVMPVV